tara:strand:- start:200 stop:376 length:177 start_codon:yes stop_codon:yes gene_type:complete
MELKKADDFDSEDQFAAYTLEMFVVSEICKKSVADLNDLDVAKAKRVVKTKGGRLSWV